MTVREALEALEGGPDPAAAVIVLGNERGELAAAAVLGVALDEAGQEASLLIGELVDGDAACEEAISVGEARDALREIGAAGADWPLFAAAADADGADAGRGGSLVGHSVDEDVEIFAFLLGPRSSWEA